MMPPDDPTLHAALAEASAARLDLARTLAALRRRLSPKAVAFDAARDLGRRGRALAADGIDTAKEHPLVLTGIAAAVALLLARKTIIHRAE